MSSHKKQHIHFIGICGVAMSALAVAYHNKGYIVTGSDKGFYPPVSTYLKDAGISYYPGWHVEKMTQDGDPDLVVVGNVAGSQNPEWLYVQENKLDYVSYPEAIARDIVKEHSIVCAGTYGKSTTASLLSWVLLEAGFDPSYMFGGISLNNIPAAAIGNSEYSVLEGDEYKSARWDDKAKFFHYSPTHLLLTSVVWDHADVYPTEKSYIAAFEKLVKGLPEHGLFVVSEKVNTHIAKLPNCQIVTYGKSEHNDYRYDNVKTTKEGTSFIIFHNSNTYNITTSSLGDYMADNMTGCFVMAHQLGMEPKEIITHLRSYKNIKRRLEKRFEGDVTVFDDIAHSPTKAEKVLASLRTLYQGKLIAIFEPNTGNRTNASLQGYDHAFNSADIVYIPRLSSIKMSQNDAISPVEGDVLAKTIARTHPHVQYIPDDNALVDTLLQTIKKGDCVAFLGSHGFRGMIDRLGERLG